MKCENRRRVCANQAQVTGKDVSQRHAHSTLFNQFEQYFRPRPSNLLQQDASEAWSVDLTKGKHRKGAKNYLPFIGSGPTRIWPPTKLLRGSTRADKNIPKFSQNQRFHVQVF